MCALWIGLIAGVVCFFMVVKVKALFGYDDSLDAFGVHGAGGTLGAILTGIFANSASTPSSALGKATGLFEGNGRQVLNQARRRRYRLGPVDRRHPGHPVRRRQAHRPARHRRADERTGLDLTQHGEEGYDWAH